MRCAREAERRPATMTTGTRTTRAPLPSMTPWVCPRAVGWDVRGRRLPQTRQRMPGGAGGSGPATGLRRRPLVARSQAPDAPHAPRRPPGDASRSQGRRLPRSRMPWMGRRGCTDRDGSAPDRPHSAITARAAGTALAETAAACRHPLCARSSPSASGVCGPTASQAPRAGTRRAPRRCRRVCSGPPAPPRGVHAPCVTAQPGAGEGPRARAGEGRAGVQGPRQRRPPPGPRNGGPQAGARCGLGRTPWAASLAMRGLTNACSRRPPASARASLRLSGAAEARR